LWNRPYLRLRHCLGDDTRLRGWHARSHAVGRVGGHASPASVTRRRLPRRRRHQPPVTGRPPPSSPASSLRSADDDDIALNRATEHRAPSDVLSPTCGDHGRRQRQIQTDTQREEKTDKEQDERKAIRTSDTRRIIHRRFEAAGFSPDVVVANRYLDNVKRIFDQPSVKNRN